MANKSKRYNYIWTIKDLYEYAVAHGIENYLLLVCDEGGMASNCVAENMIISHDDQEVCL